MQRTFSLITLGCPKNEVDSNKMKTKLIDAGYTFVDDQCKADAIIVNTCSFLTSAVEESIDVILSLVDEQACPNRKIVVAGCLPSRYGQDLNNELSEVAAFVSTHDENAIVSVFNKIFDEDIQIKEKSLRTDEGQPYAYVKISDGCDRFCSYCMIPHIRGRYHSFEMQDILAEVSELVSCGIQEIIFIGQDTGIWGNDLKNKSDIVDLLSKASDKFPKTWFRLLYIQPEGITDKLLSLINERDNICPYLDIPFQHVNSDVLKAMNRHGGVKEYSNLIENIRTSNPDIAIRSTFMSGFPGETQQQHDELVNFINRHPFDFSGVFMFSPEDGTKAAEMKNQICDEIKVSRAQEVQDSCEAGGFFLASSHCNECVEAIIEGCEDTTLGPELLARSQFQAPEIDGQIHIQIDDLSQYAIGQHIFVKITDSFCFELSGEIINDKQS